MSLGSDMLNPGLLAFPEAVGASPLSPSSGISSSFPPLILHSLPSSNLTGLPSASVFQGNSFSCPQQSSTQTREASLTTASLAPIINPCSSTSKAQNSPPLCTFGVLSLNPAADSHTNKNGGQDEKPKLHSYSLQKGLEWKIVGVTSLSENFPKGMLIQSAATTHNDQQQESPDVQLMPERSTPSRTGPGTVSPKGNEQWTIVGVTSLDQAVGFTGTLPLISSPTTLVSPTSAELPKPEICDTNYIGSGGVDTGVPLLPGDPSALCCQWKIAGITSLPVPTVITAPQANLPNAAVPQLMEDSSAGSKASPHCVQEGPKWKVVGMTSISSEKLATGESPASPVPLVTMAAAGPLVSVPAAPASAVGEGAWKVVGVVPLPQTACGPNSRLASQSSGVISCDQSCAPCSTLTSRKILPTTDMPKEVRALPHPLSFLKNCSNHFRNAVLKKNTVSTMLELKRAYEKRCRLGNKANPLFSQESSSQAANNQRCKGQCMTDSFVSADDRTVLSELYHSQVLDQSRSTSHSESREPTGSYSEMTKQSAVSENQIPESHEEKASLIGSSKHAKREQGSSDDAVMLYDQWRVFKSEGNELVMTANSEGDGVHLAAVDPWGVCTDEDLDEIAEMMAERADKTPPSSSRKRKLSTPRKMVQ